MAARVRRFITPKVLAPIMAWLVTLWLIHRYLFALPLPEAPKWVWALSPSLGLSSKNIPYVESAFPTPPKRMGDNIDSVDPLYRAYEPLPEPEAPFPQLRPTRFLPKECLESWFIYGELACTAEELGDEDTLDATWLWVNGTDKRWAEDERYWTSELGVNSPPKHFREQNELVYSMRSVVTALKGHIKNVHLVLYDYAFNATTDIDLVPDATKKHLERKYGHGPKMDSGLSQGAERHLAEKWRVAQTPKWLDFSAIDKSARGEEDPENPYPNFRYAAHSEIFYLPTTEEDPTEEAYAERQLNLQQWREKALPTYNSMAIESRIGWIPGLEDVSVALNDDFFILREHAVSDFHSPLFGSVIRFDNMYQHQVKPVLESFRLTEAGETGGLYHANYLLSKRFPEQLRRYFAHAPKVITRGLQLETNLMFKDHLTLSTTRRFREAKIGFSDIQIQWLLTAVRVERWREALLWTWAVANMGIRDGMWDDETRTAIRDLFGMTEDDGDVAQIEVHRGERWTTKKDRLKEVFAQAGWDAPKVTNYLFSSMDGHIPQLLEPGKGGSNDVCILDLDECFGSFWSESQSVSATEAFRRLTFEKPECGDCMITALVTASGPLGLSAVFPPATATFTNPETDNPPHVISAPHLPLEDTWEGIDFSIENVMHTTAQPGEEVDLRHWCMLLLSRYLYVSGSSLVHFHMLRNPDQARKTFDDSLDKNRQVSILGLNDDIDKGYDEVRGLMNKWFNSRWPEPNVWERQ